MCVLVGSSTGAQAASSKPDLFISVSGPAYAYVNEALNYNVAFGNRGAGVASSVVITNSMPTGTTFVSYASDPCWTQSGSSLTCTIGSVDPNTAREISLTLRAPSKASSITNTAQITMSQHDPTPADNTSSLTTTVTSPTDADLQVGLSADPTIVQSGDYVTFSMGVVNQGPAEATGVILTNRLPNGFAYVASKSDPSCSTSGQTVTCPVGAVSNHGVTEPVQVTAQPSSLGTFTDTASVGAEQPDPDTTNNTAAATVTVVGPADLGVTIAGPTQADIQTVNTFTMDVTDRGPDTATNTTLDFTLPDQMPPASVPTTSQGTCEQTSVNSFHCQLGDIGSTATAEVMVQTYAYQEGTGTTSASVASDRPDPNPTDNTASLTTTVTPVIDLQVAGDANAEPGKAQRSTVRVTIIVYNGGASTATSVSLSDTWAGTVKKLQVSSISTDQGTCFVVAVAEARCEIGTLDPGAAVTVTVLLTTQGSGTVSDSATATAAEKDVDGSNNSATWSASVP